MADHPAQALLVETCGVLEETLVMLKSAQDETARLKKEAAAAREEVVLQKVAAAQPAATPAFSEAQISTCADELVALGALAPQSITKFASDLASDPSKALVMLVKMASFSATAPKVGRGVPKHDPEAEPENTKNASSSSESEETDWSLMIREGA